MRSRSYRTADRSKGKVSIIRLQDSCTSYMGPYLPHRKIAIAGRVDCAGCCAPSARRPKLPGPADGWRTQLRVVHREVLVLCGEEEVVIFMAMTSGVGITNPRESGSFGGHFHELHHRQLQGNFDLNLNR